MGEHDGLAAGALDQRGDDVALVDLGGGQVRIGAVGHEPLVQSAGLAGHGHQRHHAVAAVDAQILGDRAQFMGGVELAAAVEEVVLAVVAVDVAVADFHAQVVLIAALAVHQRAEQALLDHVEHHHFVFAVAAVFKQHQRDAGLLAGVHHFPALLHRARAAHLEAHAATRLERVDAHADVGFPGGEHDDRLGVALGEQLVIVGIAGGALALVFLDMLRRAVDAVLIHVAHRDDFHVLHLGQRLDPAEAASAQTDDAQFNESSVFIELHN